MDASLVVDIHHHSTELGRLLDVALRTLYHVVDIEGFLAGFGHSLEHGESKGDVGNERAVHHVEVEPVGLTAVDHVNFAVEVQKIGSE
jgi:hypothetical protein